MVANAVIYTQAEVREGWQAHCSNTETFGSGCPQ